MRCIITISLGQSAEVKPPQIRLTPALGVPLPVARMDDGTTIFNSLTWQMARIRYHWVLRPLSQRVMQALQTYMRAENYKSWRAVFFSVFLILECIGHMSHAAYSAVSETRIPGHAEGFAVSTCTGHHYHAHLTKPGQNLIGHATDWKFSLRHPKEISPPRTNTGRPFWECGTNTIETSATTSVATWNMYYR